jgi:hypothetical protein
MFTSSLSPEQWAEARRLRAEGATFATVGRQLGVSACTITKRAHKEDWPSPAGSPAGSRARAKRSSKPSPLPADTADIRRGLARRLYTVMDLNLELMELRMHKQLKQAKKQKDGDTPAGDVEKDMRQLATTMKTIEQATELDPDLHRAADGGAKSSDAEARASEADAFRREIAERIEKLIPPS